MGKEDRRLSQGRNDLLLIPLEVKVNVCEGGRGAERQAAEKGQEKKGENAVHRLPALFMINGI